MKGVTPLAKAIDAASTTQAQIARDLDINPKTMSAYTLGTRKPKLPIARKIARRLGMTLDELFPPEESDNSDKATA